MYRKMLVPLDGSELAENALEHVKLLVGMNNAKEITFLRVIDSSADLLLNLATSIKERIEKEIKDYLDSVADTFRKRGITAHSVVLHGNVAETILHHAEQNGVGIIVMSTHGRSGLSRFFAGSVAEKVIRHSTIPVLIVPPAGARTSE